METQWGDSHLRTKKQVPARYRLCCCLGLGLPASRTVRNNIGCSSPAAYAHFVVASEQTKMIIHPCTKLFWCSNCVWVGQGALLHDFCVLVTSPHPLQNLYHFYNWYKSDLIHLGVPTEKPLERQESFKQVKEAPTCPYKSPGGGSYFVKEPMSLTNPSHHRDTGN